MDSIVDRVIKTGKSLGGPNYLLPARLDFKRLNRSVKDARLLLVAVYVAEAQTSASPCDEFKTFNVIRRSPAVQGYQVLRNQEVTDWRVGCIE